LSRGEPVTSSSSVRAMVPMSVRGQADVPSSTTTGSLGNRVSSFLVDLPVGEPSPVVRLHQVTHSMRERTAGMRHVGADTLVRIGGFAPPTLHALGARAASGFSKRIFNLVVTNVPGPQFPLYAAGARMLELFPVVPLAKGQALAIGLTSYDGGVYYGLNGDRDAMPDVDVLAGMVHESLDELRGTIS
jgi:diacylglycerol O-acyltransferase